MRSLPECVVLWQAVSAGDAHTCGIAAEDKKLYCWGSNYRGQLNVPANVSAWLVSD